MNLKRRVLLFILPFGWLRRGCFDWEAVRSAWRQAFRLSSPTAPQEKEN